MVTNLVNNYNYNSIQVNNYDISTLRIECTVGLQPYVYEPVKG